MVGEILLYTHAGLLGAVFYLASDGMRYADITAEYRLEDKLIKWQLESKNYSTNEIIEKYTSTLNRLDKIRFTGPFSWHAKRSGIKFISNKLGLKM